MFSKQFALRLFLTGPRFLRGRAMHVSDRMFLGQTICGSIFIDMLYEFIWLPLVELKNELLFIAEALVWWIFESTKRFVVNVIIRFLDTAFPEPVYNRPRYNTDGSIKTGSRALRFLKVHHEALVKFIKYFPLYCRDRNSGYYWKYYVGYFWHQTIKRELFGHRWNPTRNMMVLVEWTATIFAVWALGWHFNDLVALVWPANLPGWFNIVSVLVLVFAELLAIGFVRFLSWIEFFKYEIEFFYTSPWHQDGGKLNGRTLIVNLIWRLMNAVVFLAIATYAPRAIDLRVYQIVTDAYWWLGPIIFASTILYFAMPICHFLEQADDMNKVAVSWVVTVLVLVTITCLGWTGYRIVQVIMPEGFSITLPHFDLFGPVCYDNCVPMSFKDALIGFAKIIGIAVATVLVLIGVWLTITKLAGKLNGYRERMEDKNERIAVYQLLWWIPSMGVMLFWAYFIPRYYHDVYIPDKLAAEAAIEVVATQIPPSIPATVTVLPSLVVQPTVTNTPDATFTPTLTFVPLPTDTALPTSTMTPTLTVTPTITKTPVPGATQDMSFPEPVSEDAHIECAGAIFQVGFDPESSFCPDGNSGRFNLVSGGFYYVTFAVNDGVARYTLDGFDASTTTCTLNGQSFTGRTGFVPVREWNTNSRLECPDLQLTGTTWSTE